MRSEEIQQLMQRRVAFDCNRYFREGWNFFKFNCCILVTVTLTMTVIATLCSLGANGVGYAIAGKSYHYDEPYPTPTYYPPYDPTTPEPYYPSYPTYPTEKPDYPSNPTTYPVPVDETSSDYDYYDDDGYGRRGRHWRRDDDAADAVSGVIGGVLMVLVGYPLIANCFLAVFNAMRSNTGVRFGDAFTSLTCARYCRMLGLGLLLTVLKVLLTLCFIIPGIWFTIASAFAVPIFADRGLGAWQSIKVSIKVIHKHFCSFLGFLILLGLLQFLGALCLLVGVFVTIPVAFVTFCYCYHHVFGVNGLEHIPGPGDSESDAPIPPVAQPVQVVADPIAPPVSPPYNPQPPAPMPYSPHAPQSQYPAPSYIPTATPVYPPQHVYAPYSPHVQTHAGAQPGVQMQPVMHAIPVQFAPNGPYGQPGQHQ